MVYGETRKYSFPGEANRSPGIVAAPILMPLSQAI